MTDIAQDVSSGDIRIECSGHMRSERQYVIDAILRERMQLDCRITFDSPDPRIYTIQVENGNSLRINGEFWNNIKGNNYLCVESLPGKAEWSENAFCGSGAIPVLFGNTGVEISENKIDCGIDIFASIFFMLTRWEEYVLPDRDAHDRFPAAASCAYKNGFLDIPVVDMYVEMLWNMLKHLGYTGERKQETFRLEMQHDIDEIRRYRNWGNLACVMGGDLLDPARRGFLAGRIGHYLKIRKGAVPDPYDSLAWMMDREKEHEITGKYYFMTGGSTRLDAGYRADDQRVRELVKQVSERGHTVGFHPGYNTYNDPAQWSAEKSLFEDIHGISVAEGRQHYLRFSVPETWQVWEDYGMETDSSMYYADAAGFRCGTCHPFPVFNIRTRKQLTLIEKPLVVMDTTFQKYMRTGIEKAENEIMTLAEMVRKYRGTFTVLWHNTSIFHENRPGYHVLYEKILALAGEGL